MTKSTITREWLQQTIAELESVRDEIPFGIDTNSELELAAFKIALAAMDSEPVEWLNGCNKSVPAALRYLAENPRPIGGESSFNTAHLYQLAREIELMAEGTLYRHAQPVPECHHQWKHGGANTLQNQKQCIKCGRVELDAQPAPVVMVDLLSMAASAIEDLLEHTDPNTNYYSGVWADVPGKLRAAMLQAGDAVRDLSTPVDPQVAEYEQNVMQAGNSPVIPDGYVMVPKDATLDMLKAGAKQEMKGEAFQYVWQAMLAAAPELPGLEPAAPQEVKSES